MTPPPAPLVLVASISLLDTVTNAPVVVLSFIFLRPNPPLKVFNIPLLSGSPPPSESTSSEVNEALLVPFPINLFVIFFWCFLEKIINFELLLLLLVPLDNTVDLPIFYLLTSLSLGIGRMFPSDGISYWDPLPLLFPCPCPFPILAHLFADRKEGDNWTIEPLVIDNLFMFYNSLIEETLARAGRGYWE